MSSLVGLLCFIILMIGVPAWYVVCMLNGTPINVVTAITDAYIWFSLILIVCIDCGVHVVLKHTVDKYGAGFRKWLMYSIYAAIVLGFIAMPIGDLYKRYV